MRRSHLLAVPAPPAEGPATTATPPAPEPEPVYDPVLERYIERAVAPYRPHMPPATLQVLRLEMFLFLTTDPAARKLVARLRRRLVATSGDVALSSGEDEELDDQDGLAHGGGGRL
jgi:hypothetical protein